MKKTNSENMTIAESRIDKDFLTGVYNRVPFLELLEKRRILALSKNSPNKENGCLSSIIYFNIAKFKLLNSAFGLVAGDKCLKNIATILTETFETDFVSHFFSDHFVVFFEYLDEKELFKKIEEARDKVLALNNNFKLKLNAGVFYYDGSLEASLSCDLAKIACDEIEDKGGQTFYNVYSEKLKNELEIKKYIQDNIDKAISFDYIQVYFQPVIRTLTGKLCSMEALSRWHDPIKGYLSPSTFVPALEDYRLIHKLDYFVVEKVAKTLRDRLDKGLECVPISVNLSRRDFEVSSPYEKIEKIFSYYNLPREYLCIEITESAVMEEPEEIKTEIEKLRNAGFEVWMDDFGSSYSSLNTLKDFYFDLIKIDMGFLKDFDTRSKTLISSIVDMAKKLKMHTLAEGVEKEEQVEFLKQIGCEKIQGNFYDKPQSEHSFWAHLNEKNIIPETSMFRLFYDKTGEINFLTENSIGLFEDYGDEVKEIFINESYQKILAEVGYKEKLASKRIMENSSSAIVKKIRNVAKLAEKTMREESLDFVLNNSFYKISLKVVAECRECKMIQSSIYTSEMDTLQEHVSEADLILRNLITAYDSIYLLDREKSTVQIIYSTKPQEQDLKSISYFTETEILKYSKNVYWKDREHFLRFHTIEYIAHALKKSGRGNFSESFRIKQSSGNFEWTTHTVVAMPGSKGQKYILCLKPSSLSGRQINNEMSKIMAQTSSLNFESEVHLKPLTDTQRSLAQTWTYDANLWNAVVEQSNIKFFWKDLDRRFVGANRAFLNYYGFSDVNEIIGKTDDDLGWHLNDEPFKKDELRVLQNGEVITDVSGQNVIQGVVHNIAATKFPVYEEGKICGLLGFFIDVDEVLPNQTKLSNSTFIDATTGFMNVRGFLLSTLGFQDNYRLHNQDFAMGILEIPSYANFYKIYGSEVAEELSKVIADKIRKYFDKGTVLARLQSGRFAICKKNENDIKKLHNELSECASSIRAIREVNGKRCRLYVSFGEVLGSEAQSIIQLVELLISRMTEMQKKNRNFSSLKINLQLEDLRMFFYKVRVIDVADRKVVAFKEDGTVVTVEENCCSIWGRGKKCTNCTSARAMANTGTASKFEILGKNIFFVISHYVNVDGRPYVIEAIVKLDGIPFANDDRKDKFFDKLSTYSEEIYIDSLTKVKNRKYYDEQISSLSFKAVAFLDMNRFKHINDNFGHREGDRVLQEVAAAIAKSVRTTDIVSRYGGDEFVVCFDEISKEVLKDRLAVIKKNVAKVVYGKNCQYHCSIGIGACYGPDKADTLVLRADKALYESKSLEKIVLI